MPTSNVIETERALLATILNSKALYAKVYENLKASDFSKEYKPIYSLISEYYKNYEEVDLAILINKSPDHLRNYIIELLEVMALPSLLDEYISIIKENSKKSQLIDLCKSVTKYENMKSVTSDKLVNVIQTTVSRVVIRDTAHRETALDLTNNFKKRLLVNKDGVEWGVLTGFNLFDSYTKGLQKGKLYVLAANTGIGKSALAASFMKEVSNTGKVMYFSFEMGSEELYDRLVVNEAQQPLEDVTKDSVALNKVTDSLSKLNFIISDKPFLSASDIYIRTSVEQDVKLVIIDYLHLMNLEKGDTQALRIGNTTSMLKRYATLLHVPILLLSQFNRNVNYRDSKEPILADLKESSSIEQDADVIVFLYKYKKTGNDLLLKIAKNRGGCTGKILNRFNPSIMTFEEVSN